jgi:hypothetical protein
MCPNPPPLTSLRQYRSVRFENFMAVKIQAKVFWVVILCSVGEGTTLYYRKNLVRRETFGAAGINIYDSSKHDK